MSRVWCHSRWWCIKCLMFCTSTCKGQHRATPDQPNLHWPCVFPTLYGSVHYGYSVPSMAHNSMSTLYVFSMRTKWQNSISKQVQIQTTILLVLLIQSANQSKKKQTKTQLHCLSFSIFKTISASKMMTYQIHLVLKRLFPLSTLLVLGSWMTLNVILTLQNIECSNCS